jgi:hypothetical protein
VKHIQRILGHKDAAMTLNVYASLFGDDLSAPPAGFEPATRGLGMRPGATVKIITSEPKYPI